MFDIVPSNYTLLDQDLEKVAVDAVAVVLKLFDHTKHFIKLIRQPIDDHLFVSSTDPSPPSWPLILVSYTVFPLCVLPCRFYNILLIASDTTRAV